MIRSCFEYEALSYIYILTAQLYNKGCNITGIDFLNKMLNIAQQKMPSANFIIFDVS